MSNHNIWNNSWGSITNRESTPPSGWSWEFGKNVWQYSGQITTPTTPPTTVYQTSSIDCFPDVVVNTTGDPITIPTGEPVHIPGTSPGRTTPTPPAPSVSNPIAPVPTFGQIFNVCFDDGLLNQKGWTRPRYEGCKLRSLYYNEYTDKMDEGKELSTIKNANLETSIDGLEFIITSSHQITFENKNSLGNPFESDIDSGIVKSLFNVSRNSLFWANEFREDLPNRERYPPKSAQDGDATGIDQTYQKQNKSLAFKPFGPKVYDVPLVPTSYYKLNHYTQEESKIERKPNTFDLIPTPIKLNPIDPTGLNGGPTFLGKDPGQNEQATGNDRLSSEHQIRTTEREYVWDGPWSYTTDDGTLVNSNTFPGGVADPTDDQTWGYNETIVSRSAIIPQTEIEGDITYGKSPVIENYSNAIFFGNTVYGYQQSDVFPGPGPDFSYVKLEKAYIFNSDDDSFFVQEIKSEGEDRTFQNLMQSTFPWATDFRVKLLDYDQENNLKTGYGVHWNRGYFSEIATYSTASANRTSSGHYPGTGTKFTGTVNEYIDGGEASDTIPAAHAVVDNNGNFGNDGAYFRKDHPDINGGGYFYLHSDNGGGEGGYFSGGFKSAGMDFGRGELDFPKYQTEVAPGNWKTGPGVGSYFGIDPLPGGMRYYTFRFHPVHRPLYGMSAGASSAHTAQPEGYSFSTNFSGRVLAGTFEVNDKNPSTDWWFSKGGEKAIRWVSESKAADVTSSLKIFMDECHKQEELYILTFNEAKFVDKSFNQGFTREDHPYKKRTTTDIPGYPGDPALGYSDAYAGEDDNVSPYSYYVNYTRPLNTFGSMLYSNRPEAVGVKNAHNLLAGMGDGAEIGMGWYDYSEEALNWSAISGSQINPDTGNTWSVHDKGYKGKYTGYGPMGGIYAGGINAPRFLNGTPFVEVGDVDGIDYIRDGLGSSNERDPNDSSIILNPDVTIIRSSVSVWTAYMYGNNYRYFDIGDASSKFIDFRERKKWPGLNTWTISKLEEKPNYLLTDLNKREELPQGVGDKGFILIPDTLNPRIKANLDFYLMKAGLIDKERAPKYKDKSIKRNTFLPPRIKLKKRKRRGWFWKLKKRIKGKDY